MKNNLFHFATSELSQDAILAWLINWYNDPRNPRLRDLSRTIVSRLSGVEESEVAVVDIFRQLNKIDLLLILNQTTAVIIEDKTWSEEHNDQINRYRKSLEESLNRHEFNCNIQRIRTVYIKTGFFTDDDRAMAQAGNKVDLCLNRQDLYEMIAEYRGEHPILEDYVSYLEELEEEESRRKEYWFDDGYYVSKSHISQCALMRHFFPKDRWTIVPNHKYEPYQIYLGSSFGRPWTQMAVYYGRYSGDDASFSLFWRIDTDRKGAYLSLRLYDEDENHYKTDPDCHEKKWAELKDLTEKFIAENNAEFNGLHPAYFCTDRSERSLMDQLVPRNKGKHREAEFFHYRVKYFYVDGKTAPQGDDIINLIRRYNDWLIEQLR